MAQDFNKWKNDQTCKGSFQKILDISLDPRPKVRRRAVECIKNILNSPPTPALCHPLTAFTIDYYSDILEFPGINEGENANSQLVDALVFLKSASPVFVKQSGNDTVAPKLMQLCTRLLSLPVKITGDNSIITQWVFNVITSLLSAPSESKLEFNVILSILGTLIEISPYENDLILTPAWIEAVTFGFKRLSEFVCELETKNVDLDSGEISNFIQNEYGQLVSSFFRKQFLQFFNPSKPIRSQNLEKVVHMLQVLSVDCISNSMIESDGVSGSVSAILSIVNESINNVHLRDQWEFILKIAYALVSRVSTSMHLVEPILQVLINFRDDRNYNSSYPCKAELENVLKVAVYTFGIEKFCSIIPLNLDFEAAQTPKRPYLIALFGEALSSRWSVPLWYPHLVVSPQTLNSFCSDLFPLANKMLARAGDASKGKKDLEAKIYETLGIQIWELLPKICASSPNDVVSSFAKVAPLLGKTLTTGPQDLYPDIPSNFDFRPLVCKSIESLVDTFKTLSALSLPEHEAQSTEQLACRKIGEESIGKIKQYSKRFISALCNIYSTVDVAALGDSKSKGQALQSNHEKLIQFYEKPIRKLLEIAPIQAIADYFNVLVESLKKRLSSGPLSDIDKLVVYSMFELSILFLKSIEEVQIPTGATKSLYEISIEHIVSTDGTLQKKCYKYLIAYIDRSSISQVNCTHLVDALLSDTAIAGTSVGAIKSRILLFQSLVSRIEDGKLLLRFVAEILPEIMLATKESNEKTRTIAYDCLTSMTRRMMAGGDIDQPPQPLKNNAMIEEEHTAEISFQEFLMMVLAGLAGTSSHMQSASIASLGRLLYEFSGFFERDMIEEVLKTVLLTFSFKNREVTKSSLGFIKICAIILPNEIFKVFLPDIVKNI
jgi:hypothetical protein